MNLSFKKITAFIICISFLAGAVSMVFSNANLTSTIAQHAQKADKSGELEDKTCEEFQHEKIDYLASQFLTSFDFIRDKEYELESSFSISFLSHPPFSPPKA